MIFNKNRVVRRMKIGENSDSFAFSVSQKMNILIFARVNVDRRVIAPKRSALSSLINIINKNRNRKVLIRTIVQNGLLFHTFEHPLNECEILT